jgi:hypothetical protein
VEHASDRINLLNPATGKPQISVGLGGMIRPARIIHFTPDGRRMLSRWDYPERKLWLVEEWLGNWWPAPKPTTCFVVSDLDTGRMTVRMNWHVCPSTVALSDDGRTLMTVSRDDAIVVIECWDVPGRPSLLWVIGIPASLGSFAVLLRWWLRRRKPRLRMGGL